VETPLLRIFQRQIAAQCFAGLASAQTADSALATSNHEVFWAEIQGCMTAAAHVGRLLWGDGLTADQERSRLRISLDVAETNPLRDVARRNGFEHIDEWLDAWWTRSDRKPPTDRVVGPWDIKREDEVLSHFDPGTGLLTLCGARHPLRVIIATMDRLYAAAGAEALRPDDRAADH
jgi:hypothetical protein